MSEYGSDWGGHDYKEYKDDKEIKKEIDKEVDVEKEFKTDYDPQDLDSKEYQPFTPPDLTLKDDDSKEYHPFTPPDLALKDDDSKEYHPFTPPDLTLKEKNTTEEIKEDIIKENEPEFIGKKTIDHEITFDHIFERDLKEIVKDIREAEELHAIYAEDIMIPTNDKEAVEKYYMEQLRDEGVIIKNDVYFENVHDKEQTTVDYTNEIQEPVTDLDHEKIDEDVYPEVKENITEIDAKQIALANDIERDHKDNESAVEVKEINEYHEEIENQKSLEHDMPNSDVGETPYTDKEQEIKDECSSGQYISQILSQETKEFPREEPQEIQEEIQKEAEEKNQPEVKELLNQEIRNEVDGSEITKKIDENHVKSNNGKEIANVPSENINLDYKNDERKSEIKEVKQEPIDKDLDFKEEWEKILVEWIKEVPGEKVSSENKEELVEIIKKYHDVREDYKFYLCLKHEKEEISEDEREHLKNLTHKFKEIDEKEVEMFKELSAFRYFYDYNKERWYDSVINSRKEKYPKLLAEKLRRLKYEEYNERYDDLQYQESQDLSAEIIIENYEQLKERYKRDTGGRAIYGGKETKGFISWKEGLNERQEELHKESSEDLHEIKEEWVDSLKNHIHDISDEEISKDVKEELTYVIENYGTLKKIVKKLPPNLKQFIEDLKQFQATYDIYKERGYEKSIPCEAGKVAKKFEKKLGIIKNEALLHGVFNEVDSKIQNTKEIIRENIYLSTELSMNKKSKIIKIIQKENLKDEDKKEIISILSNLPSEELKSLLGKNYEKYIQNFINDLNSNESITSFISIYAQQFTKSEEKIKIRIPHFKQKIIEHLKNLYALIDGTTDQKELIWSKFLEILEEYISRAENNEFYIPKDANLELIAATIIYTVIISNKNMPKMPISQITNISHYYNRYFKHLYPRIKLRFSSFPGIKKIRSIISMYFFGLIRNTDLEPSDLVLLLREKILENIDLPKQLTQKHINMLRELATEYQDTFVKYFSDLADIINQLIVSSKVNKKIGARLRIRSLVDFLEEKDINLLQKSKTFYYSVLEIFDFLKEKFPNFFPTRIKIKEKLPKNERIKKEDEYRRIVSSKLKLYVIKNIYNGKYFKNGKGKCSECLKEGLILNTDISRLTAMEFHHPSGKKEYDFTALELYQIFSKNQSNPHILKELIDLLESEEVELLCRNHHRILHNKYYSFFKYLISWENIFSLPAEEIYMLIIASINNFHLTKNQSQNTKRNIRNAIVRKLKKRFIIERFYGEYCHTCGEFSIKKHLSAFHYHHKNENTKTVDASEIYDLSCPEIIQILEQEQGGYFCSNCHSVLHYKNHIPLLDKIYNDNNLMKNILDDYTRVFKKFTLINREGSVIEDPLKKSSLIQESFEKYLTAIYEISKSGGEVTTPALMDYMRLGSNAILTFFKRNIDIIKQYVDIKAGKPKKYILNDKGKEIVSLLYHFRDYYRSFNV